MSDALELEFQMVVSHYMDAGNLTWVFYKQQVIRNMEPSL